MTRQYIVAKFSEADTRTYTYHNDGEPLKAGDVAKVPDKSGDGWQRVYVAKVDNDKPPFETKPIIGKIDKEDSE